MTDEERRELRFAATRQDKHGYYGPLCGKAADEIERLMRELLMCNQLSDCWRQRAETLAEEKLQAERERDEVRKRLNGAEKLWKRSFETYD